MMGMFIGTCGNIVHRFLQQKNIIEDTADNRFPISALDNTQDDAILKVDTKNDEVTSMITLPFSDAFKKIDLFPTKLERVFDDKLSCKYLWINLFGFSQNIIGRTFILDSDSKGGMVKLENNKLYPSKIDRYDNLLQDERVKQLVEINASLKSNDKNFTVVLVPEKYESDIEIPQVGLFCNKGNANRDSLRKKLDENHIRYLDLREYAKADNWNWDDLFFNTDHHWRPEAGWWAYVTVARDLAQNFEVMFTDESLDKESYNFETIPDAFLGSAGRKVGSFYAGIDDFTMIYPKWEVELDDKLTCGSITYDYHGGWFDTVVDGKRYELVKSGKYNKFTTDVYSTYNYGNYIRNDINNKKENNGRCIYIGGNSFRQVFAPYFALSYERTIIDKINMDLDSFMKDVDENDIDDVIYLLY